MSNETYRGTTTLESYKRYDAGITFDAGSFQLATGHTAILLSDITENDPTYEVITKGCRRKSIQTNLLHNTTSVGYISKLKAESGTGYNNSAIVVTQTGTTLKVTAANSWFKAGATYTLYIQNLDPAL